MLKKNLFAGLLALILTPSSPQAQQFARDVNIIVIDIELDLPLEGAIIRSWDGSQHICNEDGIALITVPDNRQVVIQASYPGYETGRIVITTQSSNFTLGLMFSEILLNQELVIEASRYAENETRTGRSVAVSGQDIGRTGEIGGVEDVIASVKLLPGVILTEFADAQPSIRGGDPQDVSASLDGFYLDFPYYWGGAFSIFDPRMVESAQLSHGVFSSRHGNTISGLIDITSKRPSPAETEVELGISAGAASLNLSIPLMNKGGILFMGRVTFIDPFVFLAKQATNIPEFPEDLAGLINSIKTAPYIRSGTVTGNYRFTDKLEMRSTAFIGADGVGIKNENSFDGLSDEKMFIDYIHYQGFLTTSLLLTPRYDMLVKFFAGVGFRDEIYEEEISNNIYNKSFSENFIDIYGDLYESGLAGLKDPYNLSTRNISTHSELVRNIQGRLDYDWEIANGFLFAAGLQEMISMHRTSGTQNTREENRLSNLDDKETIFNFMGNPNDSLRDLLEEKLWVSTPSYLNYNIPGNTLFTTSLYGLFEYTSPAGRFNSELGLRTDHYYLSGENLSLGTKPVLNPRLNLDFNLLRDRFIFESIKLTAGTGLFSSMPDMVMEIEEQFLIGEIKPTRSWTSVVGTEIKFPYGMYINIEGYYKHIYDRMYAPLNFDLEGNKDTEYYFDGKGRAWGIDLMLRKTRSRFWDGWISYSYNWTQHLDPEGNLRGNAARHSDPNATDNEWYFPYYHRFHSLNLILNVRPVQRINIYTRFGLASGEQILKRVGSGPESYPVYIFDPHNGKSHFIEKFFWEEVRDKNNRTTPFMQMDMKISFFYTNKSGKVRLEVYNALENILSFLYISQGNTYFNPYTGEVAKGRTSANYSLPFPIPSFGLKITY
ncbi:MAG: TonB-dependent receptor plug domain-containing protein [Treponema sp.]|nr:TonB-dependent receptor plug domain-containing protein [Treponema sp.]